MHKAILLFSQLLMIFTVSAQAADTAKSSDLSKFNCSAEGAGEKLNFVVLSTTAENATAMVHTSIIVASGMKGDETWRYRVECSVLTK